MENEELLKEVTAKAQTWLGAGFDAQTRQEVQAMLDNADKTELIESFYRVLEFGTGGLRGIMGAGTNRMNKYTVGMATQGLANYLHKAFPQKKQISVVVASSPRP
jgi:phosphoglucomutase